MGDIVGGALSLGGALFGGNAAQDAANTQANATIQAAQIQAAATDKTIQAQKDALSQQRADLAPFTKLGVDALPTLRGLLGQDGGMTPSQVMALDPGYQFRKQEGQTALENNQAVMRGPGLSGATLKELTQYGQDYASGEFTNIFNRQLGAAGLGQASAAGQASATGASANAVGNALMGGAGAQGNYLTQGANAIAAGQVGTANAVTGAINNYNSQQTLRNLFSNQQQTPAPVTVGQASMNTPDPYVLDYQPNYNVG